MVGVALCVSLYRYFTGCLMETSLLLKNVASDLLRSAREDKLAVDASYFHGTELSELDAHVHREPSKLQAVAYS